MHGYNGLYQRLDDINKHLEILAYYAAISPRISGTTQKVALSSCGPVFGECLLAGQVGTSDFLEISAGNGIMIGVRIHGHTL